MMSSSLPCFLCGDSPSDKCFTEQTFSKCEKISILRKQNNLRYADVVIPSQFSSLSVGYHRKCYSNFTAVKSSVRVVPKDESTPSTSSARHPTHTRSQTDSLPSTSTGVLPKVCIFCNRNRKQVNNKPQNLIPAGTKNFEMRLLKLAKQRQDFDVLRKLGVGGDFVAKEVHYHSYCRLKYIGKQSKLISEVEKDSSSFSKAIDAIFDYVHDHIIVKKEVHYLTSLMHVFRSFHMDHSGGSLTGARETPYTAQRLQHKIMNNFRDNVNVSTIGKKKVLYSSVLEQGQLKQILSDNKEERALSECALILRRKILEADVHKLPDPITLTALKQGEIDAPEALTQFITQLIVGPRYRKNPSDKTKISVNSLASDIVYATTNGQAKPQKQIMLGLSMKSLTGSRRVIDILNKYNHCISYNYVEEIETEMGYSEASRAIISPSHMTLSPNLRTGVAFNNFDRFVETLSGKGTLHDTVGIAHQMILSSSITPDNPTTRKRKSSQEGEGSKMKRRRLYEFDKHELTSYKQKPHMKELILPLDHPSRDVTSASMQIAHKKDMLWSLRFALEVPKTPLWNGFNALSQKDHTPIQNVYYLSTINESPTSNTVVLETMIRAQQVAKECNQNDIIVTYDLAIAKIALQVQSTESPTFDNLFIQIGDFHIKMALFKAIGKYIEESGLPYIMSESGVLADGSSNCFLTGKHYNRCKRLHPITYLAITKLHFQRYVKDNGIIVGEDLLHELASLTESSSSEAINISANLDSLLRGFEEYRECTRKGDHGKTAQFYMIYQKMIENYLIFSRSIKEGNIEMYKSVLPAINNLFFAFNQPNYARWLVKYHDNLLQLEEKHPDLLPTFNSGCFAIKRTSVNFSRAPIDLVLEQTINADAANKLKGISHITNSHSARQRWAHTHSMRTEILSTLYEELKIKKKEDVSAEVTNARITKDNEAVRTLVSAIKNYVNPFDKDLNISALTNIATGREVSNETEQFLIQVLDIGESARKKFIEECSIDNQRFENPIKRQKISTFVEERIRKPTKEKANLGQALIMKDCFARLLAISMEHEVDMAEVLSYELTSSPRALSHPDGTMIKSDKSQLSKYLEKMVTSLPPKTIDVVIIDGFFLIHTIRELPRTYGQLSRRLLMMITKNSGSSTHLIFDRYFTPSIKDCERNRRENTSPPVYSIHGADQLVPQAFHQQLRSNTYKANLVKFLVDNWKDDSLAEFYGNKTVYVTCQNSCYVYDNNDGVVSRDVVNSLMCEHEEADTRMVFHLAQIQEPKNIVIRANDTDVMIILLGNMEKYSQHNIWLEVGLYTKNTLRFIDINKIYEKLSSTVCSALPAFHAFTGSDYTASFFRKAKIKPLKLMLDDPAYIRLFANYNTTEFKENLELSEKFVCAMYGFKTVTQVDQARLDCFAKSYRPSRIDEPLVRRCKRFEPHLIPPSQKALAQKVRRAMYVCDIWKNATEIKPSSLNPTDFGWEVVENCYKLFWFEGEYAPRKLSDIVLEKNRKCDENLESDNDSGDDDVVTDSEPDDYEE